ncbi:RDD family protein [Chitinophaga sp. NPDC101104]|uniref:RDD family protein n=1 Tax=Chitinophaga sp. NPDC101104 TaxID=3390561 RepID=UPI003CFCE960
MYTQTEENVLGEEIVLTEASTGKRFANFLIDLAVFYATIFLIALVVAVIFGPEVFDYEETSANSLIDRLITLILYGIFLGLVEGLCKGKTLGKLITKTRAVKEDGSPVDFAHGFKRGLVRMVPFNGLSAFGSPCYPWHDKWTNTLVIDEKQSTVPNESGN